MDDAYRNIGRLYLALLSPEQVRGDRLGDDAMNRWMRDVPPGASVLDACCGIGSDVLALHRGIPMAANGGPWTAYGSDLSESLLEVARTRTSAHGLPEDRFRCSSFADLARIAGWRRRFDIVLAAHAIYTAPDGIEQECYDDYLSASLRGIKARLQISRERGPVGNGLRPPPQGSAGARNPPQGFPGGSGPRRPVQCETGPNNADSLEIPELGEPEASPRLDFCRNDMLFARKTPQNWSGSAAHHKENRLLSPTARQRQTTKAQTA